MIRAASTNANYIPAAPIFLPEGPWNQVSFWPQKFFSYVATVLRYYCFCYCSLNWIIWLYFCLFWAFVQIPGGVTAAEGFKAAGIYGGLRAKGEKPDLALVTCDVDAVSAGSFSERYCFCVFVWTDRYRIEFLSGSFTTNVVAAAPVLYCQRTLDISNTVRDFFFS